MARRAALVAVLCVPAFVVVLDSNMVTIALPSIRTDLGFSRPALQWVVATFSLGFGGGLLIAGRAGDLYGRRRLLTAGLSTFSVASIAAALAPSPTALLCARSVEGLAAAMALPAALALIAAGFDEGDARNRALAVYGMAASAAFVSGVAAGGALTALAGWRSVFLVNAPLGLAAALAARHLVDDDGAPGRLAELDLPGALAAAGAVLALLYGLSERMAAAFGASLLLASLAWALESRCRTPLLPPRLLRRAHVAGACVAALLTVGTGVGVMFVMTLYLQEVLGYGPVATGFALMPLGVAGLAGGSLAPLLARRVGLRGALAAALVTQAAGVAILIAIGGQRGLGLVAVGVAVVGIGHFGATVLFTAMATNGTRERDQGVTMGLVTSAQQVGGALGLALLVAVASTTDAVVEGFRFALATATGLSLLGATLVLLVRSPPGPES